MTEATIAKIQKLFALAGNNPNQKEAESAMLKAQMLMMENNLSEATVQNFAQEEKPDNVSDCYVNKDTKSMKWYYVDMTSVIAKNFRCMFAITSHYGQYRKELHLFGMERDLAACKATIEFAFVAFEQLWKLYHMELLERGIAGASRRYTTQLKNDYALGFIAGLKARFAEQVQTRELMIVVPNAVVTTFNSRVKGYAQAYLVRNANDSASRSRGYQDGRMAKRDAYLQ